MGIAMNRALLRSASRIALAAGMVAFLTGCSGTSVFGSNDTTASAVAAFEKSQRDNRNPDTQDYMAGAAYWGAKYEGNPDDTVAGMNFAKNLRLMGSARQAVAAMKDVVMKAPDDQKVLAEYGKDLTAAGRTEDAIPFLVRATQMDNTDWSAFSTYGVALDQRGDHEAARQNYEIALKLSPGNAAVESNVAMSYILSGRLTQAETILRRLVARPDATPQMRQNLAMIESLKGNETEAERLAREDLTADQAKNNLAVLRPMDEDNATQALPVAPSPAPTETETQPKVSTNEATIEKAAEAAPTAPEIKPTEVSVSTTSVSPAANRFQMAPIPDDAVPAPVAATPAATTKPTTLTPAVKPTTKQSTMLRKSYGTQAPISVATSN